MEIQLGWDGPDRGGGIKGLGGVGVSSRWALLRLAPRGANFIEIDYRSCLLLRVFFTSLFSVHTLPIFGVPLFSPGVLIQLEPIGGERSIPFLLSPSRSPGKLIFVRPFAVPLSWHFFLSSFDNGWRIVRCRVVAHSFSSAKLVRNYA